MNLVGKEGVMLLLLCYPAVVGEKPSRLRLRHLFSPTAGDSLPWLVAAQMPILGLRPRKAAI